MRGVMIWSAPTPMGEVRAEVTDDGVRFVLVHFEGVQTDTVEREDVERLAVALAKYLEAKT